MSIPSYIRKTETHANGIISIMQPLRFICSVINCLIAVGGTDVFRNVYLSKQYYQSACYTYIINAFFFTGGDAFVMKFANILFVKYFHLFTQVTYLYTILEKTSINISLIMP